jgi:hypothetical protein
MNMTKAEQLSEDFRASWRALARTMYEAYGDSVDWKAVSGHPMPKFEDVGVRVEGAWCIAASAAVGSLTRMLPSGAVEEARNLGREMADAFTARIEELAEDKESKN